MMGPLRRYPFFLLESVPTLLTLLRRRRRAVPPTDQTRGVSTPPPRAPRPRARVPSERHGGLLQEDDGDGDGDDEDAPRMGMRRTRAAADTTIFFCA